MYKHVFCADDPPHDKIAALAIITVVILVVVTLGISVILVLVAVRIERQVCVYLCVRVHRTI